MFAPGDTVVVNVNVKEGDRKRVHAYEGIVIAKRNRGINSSFTVRKVSSGEGVERTFQTYSPLIASVEVKRKGQPLPLLDGMIAATALAHGLTVATRNTRDFKKAGVKVDDPFARASLSG